MTGPDRDELLARIPYDVDPRYAEPDELVERRRGSDRRRRRTYGLPVVVFACALTALLTLLAVSAVRATGHAHPSAIRFAPVRIPAAPAETTAPTEPVIAVRTSGIGDPTSTPGLILEPNLATLPPRPAVEQPRPDVVVVGQSTANVGQLSHSLTGIASYYDWHPGEAAACAPLRAALPDWRGRVVSVNGISVRLTDYCPQSGRVIDLDSRTFALLAPLSRGLVTVSVSW